MPGRGRSLLGRLALLRIVEQLRGYILAAARLGEAVLPLRFAATARPGSTSFACRARAGGRLRTHERRGRFRA